MSLHFNRLRSAAAALRELPGRYLPATRASFCPSAILLATAGLAPAQLTDSYATLYKGDSLVYEAEPRVSLDEGGSLEFWVKHEWAPGTFADLEEDPDKDVRSRVGDWFGYSIVVACGHSIDDMGFAVVINNAEPSSQIGVVNDLSKVGAPGTYTNLYRREFLQGPGSDTATVPLALSTSEAYHVVLEQVPGRDKIDVFVSGLKQGTITGHLNGLGQMPLRVGWDIGLNTYKQDDRSRARYTSQHRPFVGSVGAVRFWREALSDRSVEALLKLGPMSDRVWLQRMREFGDLLGYLDCRTVRPEDGLTRSNEFSPPVLRVVDSIEGTWRADSIGSMWAKEPDQKKIGRILDMPSYTIEPVSPRDTPLEDRQYFLYEDASFAGVLRYYEGDRLDSMWTVQTGVPFEWSLTEIDEGPDGFTASLVSLTAPAKSRFLPASADTADAVAAAGGARIFRSPGDVLQAQADFTFQCANTMAVHAIASIDAHGSEGVFIGQFYQKEGAELGWKLGVNSQGAATFSIATEGADDGNGRFSQAVAAAPLPLDRSVALTGTYDGKVARLYVDGELAGQTLEGEAGDAVYVSYDTPLFVGGHSPSGQAGSAQAFGGTVRSVWLSETVPAESQLPELGGRMPQLDPEEQIALVFRHSREIAPDGRPRWTIDCGINPNSRPFANSTEGCRLERADLSLNQLDLLKLHNGFKPKFMIDPTSVVDRSFVFAENLFDHKNLLRGFNLAHMDRYLNSTGVGNLDNLIFEEPRDDQYNLDSNDKALLPYSMLYEYIGENDAVGRTQVLKDSSESRNSHQRRLGMSIGMSASIQVGVAPLGMGSQATFGVSTELGFQLDRSTEDLRMDATESTKLTSTAEIRQYALTHRPGYQTLSAEFRAAIWRLHERTMAEPEAEDRAIFEFYRTWGTNYALSLTFGAIEWYEKMITLDNIKSKSLRKTEANLILGQGRTGASYTGESSTDRSQGETDWVYRSFGGSSVSSEGAGTLTAAEKPATIYADLRPIVELLTAEHFSGHPEIYDRLRAKMVTAFPAYFDMERMRFTDKLLKGDASARRINGGPWNGEVVPVEVVQSPPKPRARPWESAKFVRMTVKRLGVKKGTLPVDRIEGKVNVTPVGKGPDGQRTYDEELLWHPKGALRRRGIVKYGNKSQYHLPSYTLPIAAEDLGTSGFQHTWEIDGATSSLSFRAGGALKTEHPGIVGQPVHMGGNFIRSNGSAWHDMQLRLVARERPASFTGPAKKRFQGLASDPEAAKRLASWLGKDRADFAKRRQAPGKHWFPAHVRPAYLRDMSRGILSSVNPDRFLDPLDRVRVKSNWCDSRNLRIDQLSARDGEYLRQLSSVRFHKGQSWLPFDNDSVALRVKIEVVDSIIDLAMKRSPQVQGLSLGSSDDRPVRFVGMHRTPWISHQADSGSLPLK